MSTRTTRIEEAEQLLRNLTKAALTVMHEVNGVYDNEWRVEDGKAVPDWPIDSFHEAVRNLDGARMAANAYLDPAEAERQAKWANACATAGYIVDRFNADRTAGKEHSGLSGLQRNIADAINGGLVQTMEDAKKGIAPTTMNDKLAALVQDGRLVKIEPPPSG